MRLIDFILNVVGLLLWVNWRAIHVEPIARPGKSLVATLKPVSPPSSRWSYLASLGGLLVIRAVFYWMIAPRLPWVPQLSLGPTSIAFGPVSSAFRMDVVSRMLLFSVLSFALTLALFYLYLLVLSCVNARLPENYPHQRFIQLHLGWFEHWPRVVKLILPLIAAVLVWYCLNPLLVRLQMVPQTSPWHVAGQGALIGAAFYIHLQYLLLGILVIYLVDSYIYLGEHAFWGWVTVTAGNLLKPIRWIPLVLWKLDFAPFIAIAIVIEAPLLLSWLSGRLGLGSHQLFMKLVTP